MGRKNTRTSRGEKFVAFHLRRSLGTVRMEAPLCHPTIIHTHLQQNRHSYSSAIAVSDLVLKSQDIIRSTIKNAAYLFQGQCRDISIVPELIHCAFINAIVNEDIL